MTKHRTRCPPSHPADRHPSHPPGTWAMPVFKLGVSRHEPRQRIRTNVNRHGLPSSISGVSLSSSSGRFWCLLLRPIAATAPSLSPPDSAQLGLAHHHRLPLPECVPYVVVRSLKHRRTPSSHPRLSQAPRSASWSTTARNARGSTPSAWRGPATCWVLSAECVQVERGGTFRSLPPARTAEPRSDPTSHGRESPRAPQRRSPGTPRRG